MALGGSSGSARGAEEELGRRWWLVVAKGDAEGLFIARVRRWSGAGVGGRLASSAGGH